MSLFEPDHAATMFKFDANYQIDNDWLLLKSTGLYDLGIMVDAIGLSQSHYKLHAVQGTFNADLELDMTQTPDQVIDSSVADIDFDSSIRFSSQQNEINYAQLDIRATCLTKGLDIQQCIVNQPQSLTIEFDSTPPFISQYFDREMNNYRLELNPDNQIRIFQQPLASHKYSLDGDLNVSFISLTDNLNASAQFNDMEFRWLQGAWSITSKYMLNIQVRDVDQPLTVKRAKLKAGGRVDTVNEVINLQVNNGASLALFDISHDDLSVNRAEFVQKNDVLANYFLADNKFAMKKQIISLAANGVEYNDILLEFAASRVNVHEYIFVNDKQSMTAHLSIPDMNAKRKGVQIIGSELHAHVSMNGETLNTHGDMLLGVRKSPLNFTMLNDLSTQVGSVEVKSDEISLQKNEVISQLIGITGFPLQLKSGGFTLNAKLAWNPKYQNTNMNLDISASQVSGDYAQTPFQNLNVDMSLMGNNGWQLMSPTQLTIDSVNIGVPLTDVTMDIESFEYGVRVQPAIRVVDFSAAALEGSVFSNIIAIDLNDSVNEFSLHLSSLSLEKLVELNQTQDLIATGVVNGELPMRLNDAVLEIDNGWMKADENGGTIKYQRIDDVLIGNDDLKLVAELLKDFHYHEMSAEVNLMPSGELRLETKLYGKSPQSQFDAPVNLNFNIDLNLWKLLESARLLTRIGQDITDQVTKPE